MSRVISIINVCLGIAIIALLAAIIADSVGHGLDKALPTKTGEERKASEMPASLTEDLAFYAPILTDGLFGRASQGPLSPIAVVSMSGRAAPVTAPSELLLLGTATGSFRETFALVRNAAKQEERVFRLGDMVFDAGRLVEVRRERAFIVVNGRKVELLTPLTPPVSGSLAGQPSSLRSGANVTAIGSTGGVIDQRALNAALDNIGQAMTDARMLPSQKNGRVEGFRISEVKPAGVFAMLGLRDGDVLLRLNDFPVDSPDKALQSFIALKGQNRLKLDLNRDGRPVTYNFDIR